MGTGSWDRLRRAATLDPTLYREAADDPDATGAALAVVIGSALAGGVGHLFGEGLTGLLSGLGRGCLLWGFWLLGAHGTALLLGLPSDLGKLFRALGFAALPLALGLFEGIPLLGVLFSLAKWTLGFAAFVVAVRALFEIETERAALIAGGGFLMAIACSLPATWLFQI